MALGKDTARNTVKQSCYNAGRELRTRGIAGALLTDLSKACADDNTPYAMDNDIEALVSIIGKDTSS